MSNTLRCAKIIIKNSFSERQRVRTLNSLVKEISPTEKRKRYSRTRKVYYSTRSVLDDISSVLWSPRTQVLYPKKLKLPSFCNRISDPYRYPATFLETQKYDEEPEFRLGIQVPNLPSLRSRTSGLWSDWPYLKITCKHVWLFYGDPWHPPHRKVKVAQGVWDAILPGSPSWTVHRTQLSL